tara:strand:- start:3919 stop:4206 length:288 start_codon:yes stop_codon:yes gene_type:complete
MNLDELDNSSVVEAQLVWARKGNQLTRKYRCVVGRRAGRLVSKPGQCSAPVDIKKRLVLKKTKARMGKRMAKKAQRTKRFNPASKALKRLNKRRK